jgi:hypothetical protein
MNAGIAGKGMAPTIGSFVKVVATGMPMGHLVCTVGIPSSEPAEASMVAWLKQFLAVAILLALPFSCLTLGLSDSTYGQTSQWPDIKNPGPDLGDFPNSAFTLPAGTCMVEIAPLTIQGKAASNQPQYYTQFLLRYGVTDDVEFRVLGNGFTWVYTEPETTGFSPISLDGKIHMWDAKPEYFLPASSLEVILSTDWGSGAFSNGYQPSINLNFDYPIGETLNLEWTVGYGELVGTVTQRTAQGPTLVNENLNQASFQWSVEKEVSEKVQLFVHGTTAEEIQGQTGGTLLGFGGFLFPSDQLAYFSSINWGATSETPRIAAQFGFSYAFGRAR